MGMAADWQTTKKDYEKLMGEKKPGKKFLFFNISSGVESALKKCDAISEKSKKKDADDKVAAEFQKLNTELAKVSAKLMKDLETEITSEKIKESKDGKLAALTMLKKRLKKYDAYFASALADVKVISSVKGKDPIAAMTEMATKTVGPILRKGLADMAALVAKLKAKPTIDTYNKNIVDTRNMTTALGKIVIARKTMKTLPDPQLFITALSPYADGKGSSDKTSAKSTWGPGDIVKEADTLAQLTKTIKTTYNGLL